jgi:hypothetical protein
VPQDSGHRDLLRFLFAPLPAKRNGPRVCCDTRCGRVTIKYTLSLARKMQKEREMEKSEKDCLATRVVDLWCSFQLVLTESKRKYPVQQFFSFASGVRQYTELTRRDRLVRRDVAVVMNGLLESLELERKRVPGEILYEADRLESLFFAGYDPHLEGDEPPGLETGRLPTIARHLSSWAP